MPSLQPGPAAPSSALGDAAPRQPREGHEDACAMSTGTEGSRKPEKGATRGNICWNFIERSRMLGHQVIELTYVKNPHRRLENRNSEEAPCFGG